MRATNSNILSALVSSGILFVSVIGSTTETTYAAANNIEPSELRTNTQAVAANDTYQELDLNSASIANLAYLNFLKQATGQGPVSAVLDAQFRADSLGERIGLNPSDLELEYEQYFNGESAPGFTLTQNFDFPTVYHHRNKLSKLKIDQLKEQNRQSNRDMLLEFSDAYLQAIYQSKCIALLEQQTKAFEKLITLSEKSVEEGHSASLDLIQSRMTLAEMLSDQRVAEHSLDIALRRVYRLSGGNVDTTQIRNLDYPNIACLMGAEEFISQAITNSPEWSIATLDSLIADRSTRLSRNEWIPKLMVGYKVETPIAGSQTIHGMKAGISLPLWSNRNNVKQSKAQQNVSKANINNIASRMNLEMNEIYGLYQALAESVDYYRQAGGDRYQQTLNKALKGGAISSTAFLLLSQDWWDSQSKYMETEQLLYQTLSTMILLTDKNL